jgi:hypothetical protein
MATSFPHHERSSSPSLLQASGPSFDTLTQAARILPAERFDAEFERLSEQAASSS